MTYQINRRTALAATISLLLSRHINAAYSERTLFWTVTPPGHSKGTVVFGYERIAAAAVLDVVKDGDALVAASQRVVTDLPQNVALQSLKAANGELKPIMQVVSPQTAGRLREVLATTRVASMVDRAPGVLVALVLVGEGQEDQNAWGSWEENGTVTRVTGTVGGSIFSTALKLGKPIDQLISEAEVRSGWQPPNLVAINNSIGDKFITYLLDLREQIGPIGGYLEKLYRQRRAEEWVRRQTDISRHGGLGAMFMGANWAYRLRDTMIQRAVRVLMQKTDENRFMLFELYPLVHPTGLLTALQAKGAIVVPQA